MTLVNYAVEVETCHKVANETGLLHSGNAFLTRLVNAQAYTHEVALRLKDRGWGMLFKTVGLNIDMLSVASIVNKYSGDVAEVVREVGSPDQEPCWVLRPAGAHRNYVDPTTPHVVPLTMSRVEVTMSKLSDDIEKLLKYIGANDVLDRISDAPGQS